MGLGLLILVSVGTENLYLSSQPEITYFKNIYKQYTNFSIETIPQYFKSQLDFSKKITITISKTADLLNKIYLQIKLPDIVRNNHSYLPENIKKIKWIDKIGLGIIKFIEIEIGGIIIDRINGEFMNINNQLTNEYGNLKGYNIMIGNTKVLNEYSNGKKNYWLTIPLTFWFCQDPGLSIPLLSLSHNDVNISIELNEFNKCYIESPTNYITIKNNICLLKENELIKQSVDGIISIARFIYFDVTNNRLYYDKLQNNFIIPQIESTRFNIIGEESKFEIILSATSKILKDESYFKFNFPSIENAFLLVNYIYLDNKERWHFINNKLEYLIPLTYIIPEKKYTNINESYKLDLLNNPTKILYWRGLLLSNYERNDIFNYTLFPLGNNNLINNIKIVINSVNREEISDSIFYKNLQIYKNKLNSCQDGIYLYSFSLFPNEYQPSGTLNFNKSEFSYLQLNINNNININNPILIKGYAIYYNIFSIINGVGGVNFNY